MWNLDTQDLSDRADVLEERLRRHAEERASWHKKWGDSRPTREEGDEGIFASPSPPRCG